MNQYEILNKNLDDLKSKIDLYNENINQLGIWLFLATLGCCSVANVNMQMFAATITGIIFIQRLFLEISGKKSFLKELNAIESESDLKLEDEKSIESIKYRIIKFRNKNLGFKRVFISVPIYYLSGFFLISSLFVWSRIFT